MIHTRSAEAAQPASEPPVEVVQPQVEPELVRVSIQSVPVAEVYRVKDGQFLGETPLELSLERSAVDMAIEFRAEGHLPAARTLKQDRDIFMDQILRISGEAMPRADLHQNVAGAS